jgi:hypothetical protein
LPFYADGSGALLATIVTCEVEAINWRIVLRENLLPTQMNRAKNRGKKRPKMMGGIDAVDGCSYWSASRDAEWAKRFEHY